MSKCRKMLAIVLLLHAKLHMYCVYTMLQLLDILAWSIIRREVDSQELRVVHPGIMSAEA